MEEFKGKVAVITGADSGIGRALADRCAHEGMKVVLSGSRHSVRGLSTRGSWSQRGTVLGTYRRRRHSVQHPQRGGKPSAGWCPPGYLRCKSPMPSSRLSGRTNSTSSRTRRGKSPFARGWKTYSRIVVRPLQGHDREGCPGPVA